MPTISTVDLLSSLNPIQQQAVKETAGKTMVSSGQPITAWYASTAGGYTFTNADVWGGSARLWTKRLRDTNGDVGSFGDLQSKAYDKDSPCSIRVISKSGKHTAHYQR